ncbi:hypothetical protein ACFE04_026086 [Oxalis oulophora]
MGFMMQEVLPNNCFFQFSEIDSTIYQITRSKLSRLNRRSLVRSLLPCALHKAFNKQCRREGCSTGTTNGKRLSGTCGNMHYLPTKTTYYLPDELAHPFSYLDEDVTTLWKKSIRLRYLDVSIYGFMRWSTYPPAEFLQVSGRYNGPKIVQT